MLVIPWGFATLAASGGSLATHIDAFLERFSPRRLLLLLPADHNRPGRRNRAGLLCSAVMGRPTILRGGYPAYVLGIAQLLGVLSSPAAACAQERDFDPDNGAWNSVSILLQIAEERTGGSVIVVDGRLDIGTLEATDAILLLRPDNAPSTGAIAGFLRSGGRVALADDFGAGGALLELFGIGRGEPTQLGRQLQLRGNPALLVARPVGAHRLRRDVNALVTNHPAAVYHRSLSPIFELQGNQALVLAGAVGDGRLVIVADPSVFIDNMMALRGNRRFAENLFDYLDDERGGDLYVLIPEAHVVGRFGEPGADRPLHDLRRALERINEVRLPPMALRMGSVALLLVALLLAMGMLPRSSPYRVQRMFAREPSQGGFAGRVGFFSQKKVDLVHPLMVYKFEFEAAVLERLALSDRALLRDVIDAMEARHIESSEVHSMRTLLLELDRIKQKDERGPTPRISPKRFANLVERGQKLLARIEAT